MMPWSRPWCAVRRRALMWVLLPSVGMLAACPPTPRTTVVRTVTQLEVLLGKHQDARIVRERWVYHAPALATYLERLGKRLAARSSRPRLPWTFRIMDQDLISAYALVGGHVYVTRGLLAHLSNEAELAALLCHEIGHIEARHHLSRTKEFWERVLRLAKIKRVTFSMQAHWIWLQTLLPSPPHQEQLEADKLSLGCLKRNGYPPRAMVHLARKLQRRRALEMLGHRPTGPKPSAGRKSEWTIRIARMRRLLGPRARPDRPLPEDLTFLRRLTGLLVAPDPATGVLAGRRYLHTQAGFQLEVPTGWKARPLPDALMASSPDAGAHLLVFRSSRKTPAQAIGAFVRRPSTVAVQAGTWKGLRGAAGRYDLHARKRARVIALRAKNAIWVVALVGRRDQEAMQARIFSGVRGSLGPLARPVPRAARPWRLTLRRAPRTQPLKAWTTCVPGPSALEPVRKMNLLGPGGVVTQGQWLKCVTRGPLRSR